MLRNFIKIVKKNKKDNEDKLIISNPYSIIHLDHDCLPKNHSKSAPTPLPLSDSVENMSDITSISCGSLEKGDMDAIFQVFKEEIYDVGDLKKDEKPSPNYERLEPTQKNKWTEGIKGKHTPKINLDRSKQTVVTTNNPNVFYRPSTMKNESAIPEKISANEFLF